MRLADFIELKIEQILAVWEEYAATRLPSAETMDALALRDHAPEILRAIAMDLREPQTAAEQLAKSRGMAAIVPGAPHTAAEVHGTLRAEVGFSMTQLVSEYRVLRASVMQLWMSENDALRSATAAEDVARFNEAVDQAIAESVDFFSQQLSRERSAREDAERVLTLDRARLEYVSRLAHVGFWRCDLPFDVLQWDEQVKHHFFLEPTAHVTIENFYDGIHPEDRELTRAAIDVSIGSRSTYDIVYRTHNPGTGQVKWIRALGGAAYSIDGSPIYFDGITVDVTAPKLDERRITEYGKAQLAGELERDSLFKEVDAARAGLRAIFEQAPAFLCSLRGPTHIFEMANERYFQLIDQGPDIVGKTVLEVLPEAQTQGFIDLLDSVYRTGDPFLGNGIEFKLRQNDGTLTLRILDFVYVALKDGEGKVSGVLVHGVDITEKRALEDEAHAADLRYRKLIDSMDEGFCVIELIFNDLDFPIDYRFIEVNPEFSRHTGLPPDSIGRTARELVPDLDPVWIERYGQVALTGEAVRFTEEARAMGRWFDVYATRLGNHDNHTVALLFRDITAQRKVDEDLRRLAAELSEASRRKSEFLAVLAHELRNPLAPIRTGLELMNRGRDNPSTVIRVTEMLGRQVNHMVHLIDDLLDVARITSGKVTLVSAPIRLKEILTTAIESSKPVIDAASHKFEVHVTAGEVLICCDQVRIAQVVSNLLTNAAKYTPDGGKIALSAMQIGESVSITVTDNGVGIPVEALPHVFDMFSQVSRNMGRSQGGLGIGLSIVRELMSLHGGTVSVSSDGAGKGSCFELVLPILGNEVDPVLMGDVGEEITESRATPLRVIVADDNVDAANILAALLELSGHHVKVSYDGLTAFDAAITFVPDVMLLDIGMPGMTGHEVAQAIRATPLLAETTLIALTGWGTEEDSTRSTEAGFDFHLTKPAQIEQVNALLGKVAAERECARMRGNQPAEG